MNSYISASTEAAVARLEEVDLRTPLRSQQQGRMRALHESNLAITSTLDVHSVLEALLEKIDLFFPYATASVVRLFNRESGKLERAVGRNLEVGEPKAVNGRKPTILVEDAAITRNYRASGNGQIDRRKRPVGLVSNYRFSYLGLPLVAKGELLGVLDLYTKEQHEFGNEEVDLLSMLAGQAAVAIQNSKLYEETKRQATELERTNRLKSEILSIVSHEVKTPLTIIMGYTEIIEEGMLPDHGKALTKIRRHCAELSTVIDSLLTAARIEAGASSVLIQEIHLGDFLNELRSFYDVPWNEELRLVWDFPSKLPLIKTDAGKLKHILQNLINNAIKFTEKGHVKISARIKEGGRRQAEGNGHERFVEFKVEDTGIGIPKEKCSVIFEMFGQVDGSKTRSHSGVGLGLYIVKTFTEMLAGKVEVESEPGKGSAFTATIPFER
jgi:signal transduction histidine kinase